MDTTQNENPIEKAKGIFGVGQQTPQPTQQKTETPQPQESSSELAIPQGYDARAVNAARAIRKRESGANYNAVGDNGTSHGAYQWQPATWQAHAKEAGLDPNDFSPKNQDEVAYRVILNRINQGYTVPELAAEWNAGDKNAYKNFHQTHGNTPQYAQDVNNIYQELKAKQSGMQTAPEATKQPTFAGTIIRDVLKTPARLGLNFLGLAAALTGNEDYAQKLAKEGMHTDYFGNITPIGTSGTTGQNIKESLGAGAELASYLIGGGEAKAGLKSAQAGLKFAKPTFTQIAKGAGEGFAIGTLGGTGKGLAEGESFGQAAGHGIQGGILGSVTGGLLSGAGAAISKSVGVTEVGKTAVKSELNKIFTDSLKDSVSGRKILTEHSQGMNDAIEAGLLPKIENGRFNTSELQDNLQSLMNKLGEARGQDIVTQNKPVTAGEIKKYLMDNVNQYVKDPLQKKKVQDTVNEWLAEVGDTDLVDLNRKQVAAGELARFQNSSDANIRQAYRSIYHGLGNLINDSVKDTEGVNKAVNDTLKKYHGIQDFLESLHEQKAPGNSIIDALTGHAAEAVATGVGGATHGGVGAVIGKESVPVIGRILRKVFGKDISTFQATMDAINKGEIKNVEQILEQVKKNKGMSAYNKAKKELLQLEAPKKGKKGIYDYATIRLPGDTTTYEKGAEVVRKYNTGANKGLLQLPSGNNIIPGETIRLPESAREINLGTNEVKKARKAGLLRR